MIKTVHNYIIQGDSIKKQMGLYHLILAPTYACNLRCRHCYLPHHNETMLDYNIITGILREWAKIVNSERGKYGGFVHIKGGEPLIMPYFSRILEDIIQLKCLRLMITTNGTLIQPDILDLLDRSVSELDENVIVNLSLDGASAQTHESIRGEGTFQKAIDFLGELMRRSIPTHINYVLNKTTLPEIEDILELAEQYDAAQVNFLPFVPRSSGAAIMDTVLIPMEHHASIEEVYHRSSENRKRLLTGTISDILERERKLGCRTCECIAGYQGFYYITPSGDVFSCPNLMDQQFSLGNIANVSLDQIHQKSIQNLYSRIRSHNCRSDYTCKGSLEYYKATGNKELVLASELFNSSLNKNPENANAQASMSFCFSRNI